MKRTRLAAVISTAAITAAGLAALAGCGTTSKAPAAAATPSALYSYYRSMMGRLAGGMMMGGASNGYGWMMGGTGYRWMTGGPAAPAWMRGHALPGFMTGTSHDPGKIMGALWANAPGPRISPAQAARIGDQTPAGTMVDRTANRITVTGTSVRLVAVASPPGGADETFRIAGLTDPAIIVKAGTQVSIQIVNADPGTAHGLVITASHAASSWLPMMTAGPAFPGAAVWFLGGPTHAGMHTATLTFTASTRGTYRYLCPVPGHARKGMAGTLAIR